MDCTIRAWRLEDKNDLSALLNNKNILNNLRLGVVNIILIFYEIIISSYILKHKVPIHAKDKTNNRTILNFYPSFRCIGKRKE